MALLQHTEAYSTPYVVLGESKEAPGYSDAIRRDVYEHHAVQCPTKEISVQISLIDQPNELRDEDWIDWGTGRYIAVDTPTLWIRVKGVSSLDVACVYSVHPNS